MKCSDCGKTLKKYFAFSEKNEKYYCMDCCYKYVNKGIVFFKCKNNKLIKLNVGVSGAGIGDVHHKFFTDEDWVLRHERCSHLEDLSDLKKPLFYCDDNKIRCSDCMYDENIELADPLMKSDTGDEYGDIMWLLPFTYEPYNIEFSFDCDEECKKGEYIDTKIIIKNNKHHTIKNIKLTINSFSAEPLDEKESYSIYCERNYSKNLILKEFHFDLIKSNDLLEIPLKIRIPKEFEIRENQFLDLKKGDYLKIPNEMMIFAEFKYKTCTEYEYRSTIKTQLVNIK